MSRSVKDVLIEQKACDSVKGLYLILDNIIGAMTGSISCSENSQNEPLKSNLFNLSESLKLHKTFIKNLIGREVSSSLSEAKQFDEDIDILHFTHGMMTCYQEGTRYVLTKDSRNGLNNYDTIINMTRNDLKNIIRVCQEMLEATKRQSQDLEEE